MTDYLLIDVGNSCVHITHSRDGKLLPMERVRASDDAKLAKLLRSRWEALPARRDAVATSVVPADLRKVRQMLRDFDVKLKMARDDFPLPMELAVENPGTIGVDRVLAAHAAYDTLKSACVVAQMGTAMTIDAVSPSGVFLGGTILPGLHMAAHALHTQTAGLPDVEPMQPTDVFGRNTEQAIRSGVYYGTIGALREIVERFATQLEAWPMLVVTGGSAPLFLDACEFIDRHVPDLVLRGLLLAADKTKARNAEAGDG